MEILDIMIGDRVFFPEINRHVVVTTIYDNGMITVTDQVTPSLANRFMRKCDRFEAIPLTAYILEKNGFKKDEKLEEMYYWNWGIGNNCISYDKETGIVRIFHTFGHLVFVLPLSYIHQLQHALKLCGIEKEIEL